LQVTYVVLKNRAMQNPTNLFITSLASADILVCHIGHVLSLFVTYDDAK
jgi:hypothetical protein